MRLELAIEEAPSPTDEDTEALRGVGCGQDHTPLTGKPKPTCPLSITCPSAPHLTFPSVHLSMLTAPPFQVGVPELEAAESPLQILCTIMYLIILPISFSR